MRPRAMRAGSTAPATSTCAMIQPPKMSPLALESAGIGITRSTSSMPSGKLDGAASRCVGLEVWLIDSTSTELQGPGILHDPMRRSVSLPAVAPADTASSVRSDWGVLKRMGPYLWHYRWRVAAALAFLLAAKVANVGVPVLLKHLVDALDLKAGDPRAVLVVPIGLLLAYAALRLSTSVFTELRELIFAKASFGAAKEIALEVFGHLHALSLRFHLERQTGGLSRDIERGTRALQSLLSYSLYTIVPTLVEVVLVLGFLGWRFDWGYVTITGIALALYVRVLGHRSPSGARSTGAR